MAEKAGFHSGGLVATRAKIGDKQVPLSINLPLKTFNLGVNMLSGVPSLSHGFSGVTDDAWTDLSGVFGIGWTGVQNQKAGNTFVIPVGIPRKTKADVNLYWSASGAAGSTAVVFDVDYRSIKEQLSGVINSAGINYTTSGAFSNATTTHKFVSGIIGTFNVQQKTTVSIPNTDVEPGSVVILHVFRDIDNATDTLNSEVWLNNVEVEFVDG